MKCCGWVGGGLGRTYHADFRDGEEGEGDHAREDVGGVSGTQVHKPLHAACVEA